MKTCSVVVTLESVDEIPWCDHSNKTSPAVHLHGYHLFFNIIFVFWHSWELKG